MRTRARFALAAALLAATHPAAPRAVAQSVAKEAAAAPTVVVIVRHAEKGTEPAADPPLTAAGEARARALADALADAQVAAVISTPFRRTRSTAAPLAAARGLTPEIIPVTGGTPAHAAAVAAAIHTRHRGHTVLVVEHSNTVPAVIRALGGPVLRELCDQQYASLFVLVLAEGAPARLVRSTYGAADAADAGGCGAMR